MRACLVDKIPGEAKLLLTVLGEGVTDPLNGAKLTLLVVAHRACFQTIYVNFSRF